MGRQPQPAFATARREARRVRLPFLEATFRHDVLAVLPHSLPPPGGATTGRQPRPYWQLAGDPQRLPGSFLSLSLSKAWPKINESTVSID